MDIHDDFFVVGDFNLPYLVWSPSEDDLYYVATNALSAKETLFVDNMSNSGLLQISKIKNNLERQLDLVFSSDANNTLVTETNLTLSTIDPYHPPLSITFCYEHGDVNIDPEISPRFNFRKANFEKLNELLTNIDFNTILNNNNNITVQTMNFYSAIFECFQQSVPYTRQKNVLSSPPWYDRELRTLRNLRNKFWKIFLRTKSDPDYINYLIAHDDFSNLSNTLYNNYISLMQADIIADPKRFWQFINSKKKSDGYPSTMKFNDRSSNDPTFITDMFRTYFSQAFTNNDFEPDADYFDYMNNCAKTSLVFIHIDNDTVVQKIDKLLDDFTSGPDGVPSIVLKKCSSSLVQPLTALFQNSLLSGVFPSVWKDSFIVPIHKKGCKSDISNYRPIAKLSCIPKLFESIVYDSLCFHCKPLFSNNQHGFLRGRSTTTNLIEFTSRTLNLLEAGNEVDVVATDFSKAFDRISHNIIAFKLRALGFPPHFLLWVDSYLKDRRYQVLFRQSISAPFTATSGVPQGSHLGPILFVLSVNDVDYVIENSTISIYADDMKICRNITTYSDCHLLQNDLNSFAVWCAKNHLELNVSKCKSITFSRKRVCGPPREYFINNEVVVRSTSIRDLGIICDSKLNFRDHFGSIINRANSALGFVKRWSREFLDPQVTKALYTTFVRPLLEYASQVWSPYHDVHIRRIEAVQRRFLRFALRGLPWVDSYNLPPYLDRLKLINMQPLSKRRIVADIVFVHQLLSGGIVSPALLGKIALNVNARALRTVPAFKIAPHRTEYGWNEPITRMLRETNDNYKYFDHNISKITLKKLLYST